MATVTLKGNPVKTVGNLPAVGSTAPDFQLVKNDLSTVSLNDYKGNFLVLNIFPSIDTGTCAASVRQFNQKAASLSDTKVLCVSKDLPFAQARFCGAEGINNVETASDFRTGDFGKTYGVDFAEGPLSALHSRAVVVVDPNGKIIHTQQVSEIVDEPDYESALAVIGR